jgi:hypothetical protein
MPASIACRISGDRAYGSNRPLPSMPSLAKRALIAFSEGWVGQYCRMNRKTSKNSSDVRCPSGVRGFTNSIGTAAGFGLPRNSESVCTL